MTGTATIRPLARKDLPGVADVIDATALFPRSMLEEMAALFLDRSGDYASAEFWLVADDGGVTGVLYCAPERMTEGTWNMLLIAVDPANQRGGVGRQLVGAAEEALRTAGARLLLVETSGLPEFDRTRAFYQGRGYHEEARIADFYQAGEAKVVFTKRL